MADITTTPKKKGKLPPLTAKTPDGDENKPKKKVVKKRKKPAEEGETHTAGDKPKATPRRKKAAGADSTTTEGGENTTPKKKKRVVKKTEEGDPTSARSGASQGEDASGSKTSLIKSPKDGDTPRKKKVKKKVKKPAENGHGGDFFDSTLAADLTEIQDDIITSDQQKDRDADEDDEYKSKQPYSTASNILKSQPTEKFYIETDSGFKGENKSKFVKRQAEEAAEKAIIRIEPANTTIEFAIKTHKVFQTILLFCHGLLAGMCLWHIVMSYVLLDFGSDDFLQHYQVVALPVQCVFFLLLVLCTVSACDRFDIANPKRGFLLKAITLQNGTISVLIYFAALVISLSNNALEDKINLYNINPDLWNSTLVDTVDSDVLLWRNLNTSRNVLSIVGWLIISLTPVADRLTINLRNSDEEDLLGVDVEAGKSAIA